LNASERVAPQPSIQTGYSRRGKTNSQPESMDTPSTAFVVAQYRPDFSSYSSFTTTLFCLLFLPAASVFIDD
jgi:hypothetical protein